MGLGQIRIENFRCLENVEIELADGLNFVFGENASGKSSLLEALFVLGRGRSFRTGRRDVLIREGSSAAHVVGVGTVAGTGFRAGAGISRGGLELRLDGNTVKSITEVAERLPVEVMDPEAHRLIAGGPSERRRYLDWSVFHVEQGFLGGWQRYQRALRQRAALLRQGVTGRELEPWEAEMGARGAAIDAARVRTLDTLAPRVSALALELTGTEVRLAYRAGHDEGIDLAKQLAESRQRDAGSGQTWVGPHRGDVVVDVCDRRARGRVSRGQQKLLAAAMIFAQQQFLAEVTGRAGVLLVDDVSAELDRRRVERLVGVVKGLPGQCLVTALDRSDFGSEPAARMFHVEQGKVLSVV